MKNVIFSKLLWFKGTKTHVLLDIDIDVLLV